MKKVLIGSSLLLATCSATAYGAEFQPFGALGIGGAGVARTADAYAPYWNPAGLAFAESTVSVRINGSAGMRVNEGLADNVDRLSKIDFQQVTSIDPTNPSDATTVGESMKLLAIVDDVNSRRGTLAVNGNAVFGVQIKHFGFGAFGSIEGVARPDADLANVLPVNAAAPGAPPVTVSDLYVAVQAATFTGPSGFFTPAQLGQIAAAFGPSGAGLSVPQAQQMAWALDSQMKNSTTATVTNAEMTRTITGVIAPALTPGSGAGSLASNTSSVTVRSLGYLEVPLSYGHPFDLGRFGRLGIGASVKVMPGRVYASRMSIFDTNSGEIRKQLTKNYTDTVTWGIDLGTMWRYKDLTVGLVAKNLNSPSFKAKLRDAATGTLLSEFSVKVAPQVRTGFAYDPFGWLTIAGDIDLTENDIVSSLNKSRNLGGGIEIHPLTWFKLRAGAYKNLAESAFGSVLTAGLTLGTKWVNFDIDAAASPDKAKYKEKSYPQEAKVDVSLNFRF